MGKKDSQHSKLYSRRECIKTFPKLLLPTLALSCAGIRGTPFPKTKVEEEYQWARRNNWTGLEAVRGVVLIGDRYLLVLRADGLGWSFPGGPVNPQKHGEKSEDNKDLIMTVTDYVHSQAMVPVAAEETVLLAYGYAIDEVHQRTILMYWFAVAVPSAFPPKPHPNMRDVKQVKWVGLDDPVLGDCLRTRIMEYVKAGEGGTIIMKSCAG